MVISVTKKDVLAGVVFIAVLVGAAVLYTYSVDRRLSFLESTIVGSCPDDASVPDDARCKQGFHQSHAKKLTAEIDVKLKAICADNNLECWQIK